MMSRGRKMIIRRRTDHKTPPHGLCKLAQSKCTSICYKSYSIKKIERKIAAAQIEPRARTNTLREPAQSKPCQDFTRATLNGNLQVKAALCRGNGGL